VVHRAPQLPVRHLEAAALAEPVRDDAVLRDPVRAEIPERREVDDELVSLRPPSTTAFNREREDTRAGCSAGSWRLSRNSSPEIFESEPPSIAGIVNSRASAC
jgi:hypothetical protein